MEFGSILCTLVAKYNSQGCIYHVLLDKRPFLADKLTPKLSPFLSRCLELGTKHLRKHLVAGSTRKTLASLFK